MISLNPKPLNPKLGEGIVSSLGPESSAFRTKWPQPSEQSKGF